MTKQPTQEQLKEFWMKLLGKKFILDNYLATDLPIDLNNLFRYAVPKLNWWSIGSGVMNYVVVEVRIYPEIGVAYKGGKYEGYVDPALALFWAIWEVIKNE